MTMTGSRYRAMATSIKAQWRYERHLSNHRSMVIDLIRCPLAMPCERDCRTFALKC